VKLHQSLQLATGKHEETSVMRSLLIGGAATILLLGAASLAIGQAPEGKSKEPGASEGKPSPPGQKPGPQEPGKAERGPAKGEAQRPQGSDKSSSRGERAGEPKDTDKRGEPNRTQGRDESQPKGAEKERPKDQPKSTQQRSKDQPKSTEGQQDRDRPKSTQQPSKDQPKATEARPDKDQPKASQATPGKQQADRLQVSEQQKSGVRERLLKQNRVAKTRINVSVHIGTAIPRSTRLHALPAAIVELVPAYRNYSYIVLEDETIYIVDPRTYVVVDVIHAATRRADRPGKAQLALSTEQMRVIYSSVPKDRKADVRVRLALGAEVPRNVQLLKFPGDVVARIPELERFSYVVVDDDVVIVDPAERGVVLVINE
jgi:hypothetical protein